MGASLTEGRDVQRRLAAVAFADVAGFAKLMELGRLPRPS